MGREGANLLPRRAVEKVWEADRRSAIAPFVTILPTTTTDYYCWLQVVVPPSSNVLRSHDVTILNHA